MFVILTYDVKQKRDAKVCKICRKYLHHIQRSVFEGLITEKKLEQLKRELRNVIRPTEDHVQIYRMDSIKYAHKENIGVQPQHSNIL